MSANPDDIPPWERKAAQATPAAAEPEPFGVKDSSSWDDDTPPWERQQPQAAAAPQPFGVKDPSSWDDAPEKRGLGKQLLTAASEFVPTFAEKVNPFPGAPVVQTREGARPISYGLEGAMTFPVAQSEHEKYKKYDQAIDFAVRHPAAAGGLIYSGIKGELQQAGAEIAEGLGETEEDAKRAGKAWATASGDVANALLTAYQSYKLLGFGIGKVLSYSDQQLLKAALKDNNLQEITRILDRKRINLKENIELSRKVNAANVADIKDRLSKHRAATAARDAEHKSTVARLDADIAEAKKNLDTNRVEELQTIKAAHEKRLADAEALETQRITELQNEHDRVVAKAMSEEQEARAAAEKLAAEKKAKAGRGAERAQRSTPGERSRWERAVSLWTRKKDTALVAADHGWPAPDGTLVDGQVAQPHGSRIVNDLEILKANEEARVKASTIYQDVKKAFASVYETTGKIWGRDSGTGAALLDRLRKLTKVSRKAEQSEVSTFMREQAARVLPLLEQKPAKIPVEGPRGGIRMEQPPPVPVDPTIALDVVRDLKKKAWSLRKANDPKWIEVDKLAKDIRASLASYIGEEAMPEKAWAALMERTNLFESSDAMEVATGRKGGDYVPVEKQIRGTPIEKVADKIFANSESILDFRRVLGDEGKFQTHLRQWLSNTLNGKTSAEVGEWLAKNRAMLGNIDVPGIDTEVETFAANLAMREGKAVEAQKALAAVDTKIANTTTRLENRLNAVAERRTADLKAAEARRKTAVQESEKRVSAETTAAKQARAAAEKESRQIRGQERVASAQQRAPQKERLRSLQEQKAQAEIERKQQRPGEILESASLQEERRQTTEAASVARQQRQEMSAIAKDLEAIVFGKGDPRDALNKFQSLKGKLVDSGIFTSEEVADITTQLEADVSRIGQAEATLKGRQTVRNALKFAIKVGGGGAIALIGAREMWKGGEGGSH